MGSINVGVIGCGYWGPNVVRTFFELPLSNLVAVADLKPARLEYVTSRYPKVAVTQDYHDLFGMSLDAVAIATPPATHYRIAADCLRHGLHVLVEKPLTLSSRDASNLIQLASEQNRTLMVGHTFEYNAAVRMLKDMIQSGELGTIHYIDSVRVNLGLFQPDLDVVWDLAPHDISILCCILGLDPIQVSAQGQACIFPGKHDIAYLSLEFPGNILAHVRLSWLDPCKVRRITVVGSHKMVVYDDVEMLEKIKIFDKGVDAPRYTETFGEFQCSYHYGNVVIPSIQFAEPLREEGQHFLDCIVEGTCPQSCGKVGLKVVEVLEAAECSLHDGGRPRKIGWYWEEDRQAMADEGEVPESWWPLLVDRDASLSGSVAQ